MNVEQAYVKSTSKEDVIRILELRLNNKPEEVGGQIDVGLPSSYDAIIAKDLKRKIAVSNSSNGWISILESKEVNDYNMLLQLSKDLNTEVLALVFSDVIGAWGFAEFIEGKVVKSYFSEEDDEIEEFISNKLDEKGIDIPMYMFREVVSKKAEGWSIIKKSS